MSQWLFLWGFPVILPLAKWHKGLLITSQHWFRKWFSAIRQQAINWANVNPLTPHDVTKPHWVNLQMFENWNTAKHHFHKIWIVSEKLQEKWDSVLCLSIKIMLPQIKHSNVLLFYLLFSYTVRCKSSSIFYTPVFRRDVLWYGAVRPSVRPSVRTKKHRCKWWIFFKFCTQVCLGVPSINSLFVLSYLIKYAHNSIISDFSIFGIHRVIF